MLKLKAFDSKNILRTELLISLFLFISIMLAQYSMISQNLSIAEAVGSALLILMIVIYAVAVRFGDKRARALHHVAFFSFLFVLLSLFFVEPLVPVNAFLNYVFHTFYSIISFVLFFFLLFFLVAFGLYFASRRNYKIAIPLFIILSAVMFIHLVSWYVYGYNVNDETLISFSSVRLLTQGKNPYATSVANILATGVANRSIDGTAISTTNKFTASYMNYPALYFLSFAPFYFASQPTLYDLSHIDSPAELFIFLALLLFIIVSSMKSNELLGTKYDFIFFAPLFIFILSSIAGLLVGALLLLCYSRISTKHSWLFLGLAVSIHQLLWLPALFLLAYSFNNDGFGKGMQDIVGAAAVFLAINMYFIILNPLQFISQVLVPLSTPLLPTYAAPIGYYLAISYHMPLNSFTPLFISAGIVALIISLCLNRKALIPLLCIIPFIFLYHALQTYYSIFIFIFAFAVYEAKKKNEKEGYFFNEMRKNDLAKYALYALVLAIFVFNMLYIYQAHNNYMKSFNISVSNQSIRFANNSTYYSADITYRNLAVNSVFIAVRGLSDNGFHYDNYGYFNKSIIQRPKHCTSTECFVNPNILQLPANRSLVHVNAIINSTNALKINVMRLAVYNNTYFYLSNAVSNGTRQ